MPNPLQRLIDGFEDFRREYFEQHTALFEALRVGQRPKVLIIGCSDSRADPAILTRAQPGDLFIVRNVAAIVPPYAPDGSHHGTSSAIEFAIRVLAVEHVVVLGHGMCGGMRALAEPEAVRLEFMSDWVDLMAEARDAVMRAGLPEAERLPTLEKAAVLCSVRNLVTFPWLRARLEKGDLSLHGWYFDIGAGELLAFDAETATFVPARGHAHPIGGEGQAAAGCGCGPLFDLDRFIGTVTPDGA
ncbi:MAG: carbonic anhydrase [Alphaproteobacteria bacterium]